MEVEAARCECCGFTEECTPEYIAAVRAEYLGRWVCGLCAEAVGDEVRRAGSGAITTAEALDRHGRFARGRGAGEGRGGARGTARAAIRLQQILVMKYSRNWTKSTPRFLFFHEASNTREPRRPGGPDDMVARPSPGRATLWSRRLVDPLRRLFAYIKPCIENPYGGSHDTRKVPEPPSSRSQDLGDRSLPAPCGAGSAPKASPSTPLPSPPPSSSPLLLP
ncbi:hypothetical protein QYE76_005990 [Lolium multiflorum]|uniref:DUF1677 family protein n=1 Tax=Lolium multiflorum TaxID=4521 RepID=A0AAD8RUS3_LOLMU|nr:hypothetical protein QYE76_005990 [Lolium multiflorum]